MDINDIIKPENKVYKRPSLLTDNHMHYCPGCSHGVVHKLVAELIEEMGLEEKTVGVAPVGCAVFAYNYIDIDWIEAAHGRAPAIATAVSRLNPQNLVFTYQGDGDLAAIGTCETIHAANRGENITIIFINNAIYGMTGGQMAPTTLLGMKTSTTPYGRTAELNGYPLAITNLLAQLDGTCYVTRQSVHTPGAVRKAKAAIKNINSGKYIALTENNLTSKEQLEMLGKLVEIIDKIRAGYYAKYAEGLFMLMELDRIKRTYPEKSKIESVFLEDYFLAFETFNNCCKEKDGEETSEYYRKVMFEFLQRILVDSIYNDGKINSLYKNAPNGTKKYFEGFTNIFTTNYDYNIENILGRKELVCHLHGEFNQLSPRYDVNSLYYKDNKNECDNLISQKIQSMDHVYSNAVMSWSWLDKYGELIEPDARKKEELFKSIGGQVEILGLSPNNDEHLFLLLNQNSKVKSVVYYYINNTDRQEIQHHINKPIICKKATNLWKTLK